VVRLIGVNTAGAALFSAGSEPILQRTASLGSVRLNRLSPRAASETGRLEYLVREGTASVTHYLPQLVLIVCGCFFFRSSGWFSVRAGVRVSRTHDVMTPADQFPLVERLNQCCISPSNSLPRNLQLVPVSHLSIRCEFLCIPNI
jgi:hypothetical protein